MGVPALVFAQEVSQRNGNSEAVRSNALDEIGAGVGSVEETSWGLRWLPETGSDCIDTHAAQRRLAELLPELNWADSRESQHRVEVEVEVEVDRGLQTRVAGSPVASDSTETTPPADASASATTESRLPTVPRGPERHGVVRVFGPRGLVGERHFESTDETCHELTERLLLSVSLVVSLGDGRLIPGTGRPPPSLLPRRYSSSLSAPVPSRLRSVAAGRTSRSLATSNVETSTRGDNHFEPGHGAGDSRSGDDLMYAEEHPLRLGLQGGFMVGPVDAPAPYFELGIAWNWLRAGAWVRAPIDARDSNSPAVVETWMLGGTFGICPVAFSSSWGSLTLCGALDAGTMAARSDRVPRNPRFAFYLASRLQVIGAIPLTGPLGLWASASFGPVWVRPRIEAEGEASVATLFTAGPWVGMVSTGLFLEM